MAESIKVSDVVPATPERVYEAWLNPVDHSKMTGGVATDQGDGQFTASDGYISGKTLSSEPYSKIVQSWRSTDFAPDAPDSELTVLFEAVEGGTRITIEHDNLPEGKGDDYAQGWDKFYFTPMKAYFASPTERMREVGEHISQAVEAVTEQIEAAAEDALAAVDRARTKARKQAVQAVRAVKKVRKTASTRLKAAGKKVKALVSKKKKPAKKTVKAKVKVKPKTVKAKVKAKAKKKK